MQGKVFLIGCGPGDAGLITVKGLEKIKKADVIVYDRLVNDSLLSACREDAEIIFAGKGPSRHVLKQDEINDLLVAKGREGKTVARLKGGDPFVFGRGGEEAEALKEAGIPFEIIPGITSAVAVPAYAGIPLTHRDFTSSFTVVTGHEDPEKETSGLNWPHLAADPGTLVFLMGLGNLHGIAENLMKEGKSGETPVAVIMWGTRTTQCSAVGTLATISLEVEKAGLTNPAVIVVGDVVGLYKKLRWFEEKPLFGKRILVTRTREQAGTLTGKIRELGGEALEFPTIRIKPPLDPDPLDRAIREVGHYQWVVFTSVNGVASFLQRMRELGCDVRNLNGVRLCAIGPQTKDALANGGLLVEFMPAEYRAEEVLAELLPRLRPGDRVLLPRADLARPLLADGLREAGAVVEEVVAYRTAPSEQDPAELLTRLKRGEIQAITFTSSSTVRNFVALFDMRSEELMAAFKKITIACIGPITAETVKEAGLRVDVVASEYTINGLVQALSEYYQAGRNEF